MGKLLILNLLFIFMITACTNNSESFVIREDTTAKEIPFKNENAHKIYLITMDRRNNSFWKSIDKGCQAAVKEIGDVNYKWIAPDEHIAALQGECIDTAIAEGADAILVSAISLTEINENLKRADEAGIKIIYVDSAASYEGIATLMTNNELAGKAAGETMLKALREAGIQSGMIGIVSLNADTQNTALRDKGFREVLEDTAFIVTPTLYINNNINVLKDDINRHPEYVGFFGANQQSTFAVSEQIKNSDRRPVIIGFDTADATLSMINEGIIYATIQQAPQKMGYEGVKIAEQALKGTYTEKNAIIDTGTNVITKDKL